MEEAIKSLTAFEIVILINAAKSFCAEREELEQLKKTVLEIEYKFKNSLVKNIKHII